jgi:hypothetical protein
LDGDVMMDLMAFVATCSISRVTGQATIPEFRSV